MHNNDDKNNQDLSALWQAQPVNSIDLTEVKKSLNSQRVKQRIYTILDILLCLPALYIVFSSWPELSPMMKYLCIFMFASTAPFIAYQLWLRRVAAFLSGAQTVDHLAQLIKQTANNVRIAKLTKHSAWPALVIMPVFVLLKYLEGDISIERWVRIGYIFLVATVGIVAWSVWAHKRQKRFEKQLKALQIMASKHPI